MLDPVQLLLPEEVLWTDVRVDVEFGDVVQVCALPIGLSIYLYLTIGLPVILGIERRTVSIGVLVYFEVQIHLLVGKLLDGLIILVCFFLLQDGLQSIHFGVSFPRQDHLYASLLDNHLILLGDSGLEVLGVVAHHEQEE